ncbi:uncharacterized protein M6B38_252870 [Iris pallida]|uniref:Uncharacterized protein n=1 Tax=Iris pallida TaxID=29817 RepID=A0AAX6FUB7_IRIPA|nr:uncharacterized protein M6B38_398795 [Iris pallida]KAJ6852896.1 uncharacterized protein M6B38_252870 [Iris pallida]
MAEEKHHLFHHHKEESHLEQEKHHKSKEHLGEMGAVAAGAFALVYMFTHISTYFFDCQLIFLTLIFLCGENPFLLWDSLFSYNFSFRISYNIQILCFGLYIVRKIMSLVLMVGLDSRSKTKI